MGSRGVLLVPDWPRSVYCMLVEERLKEGSMKLERRFRPRMVCPEEIVSDTFRGYLKFEMYVISFDFWRDEDS